MQYRHRIRHRLCLAVVQLFNSQWSSWGWTENILLCWITVFRYLFHSFPMTQILVACKCIITRPEENVTLHGDTTREWDGVVVHHYRAFESNTTQTGDKNDVEGRFTVWTVMPCDWKKWEKQYGGSTQPHTHTHTQRCLLSKKHDKIGGIQSL